MRAFQPSFVFGLLQTEANARALYTIAKPIDETTAEYVGSNIQLRTERKELITRSVDSLKLRVIMDEKAVRRMADQWNTISVSDERRDVLRTIRRFDAMRDSALSPASTPAT